MFAFAVRLCREPRVVLQRLFQCFFVWGQPAPRGAAGDAQLIVTQAMSDCVDGGSSETNFVVAELARKYHAELGIPIFSQKEVGRILEAMGVQVVSNAPTQSTTPILSKKYIGTEGVARLQKVFCDSRAWARALIVVPYPHFWRALWIYERLGLQVIVPEGLPKMKFQSNLSQWRWRRAITAYPYELAARLRSLCRGLI